MDNRRNVKVAAAVIRDGNLVFATQRGYGKYRDFWEFPGGKIEPGETLEEALVREIREELGTEVEVGELLMTEEYDYPDFHLSMDCFLCSLRGGEPTLLEHEDARWLPLDRLRSVNWLPADLEVVEKLENDEMFRTAKEAVMPLLGVVGIVAGALLAQLIGKKLKKK